MDRIPYTEMFEVVKNEWIRDSATEGSTIESKYKSHINYAYATLLPLSVDEEHLRKEAFVTTKADYSTGTITITVAGTSVAGASTAWTSANSNGFLFKATGKNLVMRVSYSAATSLTFDNSLAWTEDAIATESYRIILDRFILPTDFNHMLMDNRQFPQVVYFWLNNGKSFLKPRTPSEYDKEFSFSYGIPNIYTVKKDFASNRLYLYIHPGDTDSRIVYYAYNPILTYMSEYTTGTVTLAASTAVTGASTDFDGNIDTTNYDWYFRADADGTGSNSVWYKVASVSGDTGLTLSIAYAGSNTGASKAYTISGVSKYPPSLDRAIMLMGTALAEPDPNQKRLNLEMFVNHIQGFTTRDAKKIYGQILNVDLSGRG